MHGINLHQKGCNYPSEMKFLNAIPWLRLLIYYCLKTPFTDRCLMKMVKFLLILTQDIVYTLELNIRLSYNRD